MPTGAKAAIPIVIGLGAAIVALVLLARKAEAAPLIYIPTAEEISTASSLAKLNAYYDQLNELYISGQIDYDTYMALYNVYVERWYELAGVTE